MPTTHHSIVDHSLSLLVSLLAWIHRKSALQVEAFDVQHGVNIDDRILTALDGCELVDCPQSTFDALEVRLVRNQIYLVQK